MIRTPCARNTQQNYPKLAWADYDRLANKLDFAGPVKLIEMAVPMGVILQGSRVIERSLLLNETVKKAREGKFLPKGIIPKLCQPFQVGIAMAHYSRYIAEVVSPGVEGLWNPKEVLIPRF